MEINDLDVIIKYRIYLKQETPLAQGTIKHYIQLIRKFILNNGKGLDFTIDDVNKWIADKCRKKNYNLPPYAMRHFLISLGRKDLIHKITHHKIMPRKKVFRYIPKETLQEIVNKLDYPYQLYALMQIKGGFRIRELLMLKIQNIDFHRHKNLIVFTLGSDSKGLKSRITKINKKYLSIIEKTINNRTFGYLFVPINKQGSKDSIERWCDNTIRYYNDRLFKLGNEYNIEGLCSHYMRHCFSDYFIDAEGTLIDLQRILGHAQLNTTSAYIGYNDKRIDEIFETMD